MFPRTALQNCLPGGSILCHSWTSGVPVRLDQGRKENETSLDISNRGNLIQALVARVLEWLERRRKIISFPKDP